MIKNNIAPLVYNYEGRKQQKIIDLVNLKNKNRKLNFAFYEHSKDNQQFVWSNYNYDDKNNLHLSQNSRTVQSFFINPLYRGQIFTIEPNQNLTIKNAIVYEPTLLNQANLSRAQNNEVEQKQLGTQLLLKNNFTLLEKINLKGQGSTAFLEVIDIQKDFFTVLNEKDEFEKPLQHQERISVFRSKDFNLSAFQDIVENIQHEKSNKQPNMTQIRQFEENVQKNLYFREFYNGTDMYLFNSLFDSQFWQEFPSEDHQIKQQLQSSNRSVSEQQIYQMLQLERSFLRWNQNTKTADFSNQNYQNLIVFNIPFTDIVRKPVQIQKQLENEDQFHYQQELQKNQLFQLNQNVNGPDPRNNNNKYQEQIRILHEQRRIRQNIIDSSEMNIYVGYSLNRFDTQDYRVDIDWMEMIKQSNLGNVDVEYVHTRYIVLQNTGTLPLKIISLKLDGQIYPCQSQYRGKLKINNCKNLINISFQKGENITIDVSLSEDFKNSFKTQVLEIETDYFSQKFLFEFQFPSKSKELILNIENTKKSVNLGGGVLSLPTIIENLFFMICLIYFTLITATGIRKDFDINTSYYFYNKQDSANPKQIEKHKMKSIEVQNKLSQKKDDKQADILKAQKQLKYKNELSRQDDLQQQNISNIEVSQQQIFEQFCKNNFIQQILPSDFDNRFNQKQGNTQKSYFLENFDTASYLIDNAFQKFQNESLIFNLKPDTILQQAQNYSNLIKGPESIQKTSLKKNEKKKNQQKQPSSDPSTQLENQIIDEMSKLKNFDEENTGIRFFKNENGEIEFQFIKLNDMSPQSKSNLDTIGFQLKIQDKAEKNPQVQQNIPSIPKKDNAKKQVETQKVEKQQIEKKDKQSKKIINKEIENENQVSQIEGNESSSQNHEQNLGDQDQSFKKMKVKKLNKKDLKKREARLKKEQELIENTKKIQIQEQKLQQIQPKLQEQKQDEVIIVDQNEIDTSIIKNLQIQSENQKDFEIKSYHSSEEEIKLKKKNDDLKQKQKADLRKQKNMKKEEKKDEFKIENNDIIVKKERSSSLAPGNSQEQSNNFWLSYEKKLAEQKNIEIPKDLEQKDFITKEENEAQKTITEEEKQDQNKEKVLIEQEEILVTNQSNSQYSADQIVQPQDFNQKDIQKESDNVKESISDTEVVQILNDKTDNIILPIQDNEDDDDLPLFQQKKYLQMQLQIQKQISQKQNNESSFNESEDQKNNRNEESKQIQSKQSYVEDKVLTRKIFDKNRKVFDEDKIYSDNSQQKYCLIKSKNPHADINNPNNPNYKGKTGKAIQSSLKNQQLQKKDNENFILNEKQQKLNRINQIGKYSQQSQIAKENDQYIDEDYNIFYQSNKSLAREENIQEDYDEQFYQNKNIRFKDYYITDKSKNYDEFQVNKFYESNNKFKSTVLNYNYENDVDYQGRNQDFKKRKYNKDQSDSEDNYYCYQGFKVKGRNQGRYVSIVEDPKKKRFEDRIIPDQKYIKYRGKYGYNESRNDIYFNHYQRDASREDIQYRKEWQKDIYDYDQGDEILRGRQRVHEYKYQKDEEIKKYQSQLKSRQSYEDDYSEYIREERQVIEKQRDNTQENIDDQYDHDQIMLMRRARGRAFNVNDQTKYGRGEKIGRGERMSNYIQRGSIRGTNDFRFQRGRGAPYFSLQQEMYKFKPKEKDNQEINSKQNEKNDQEEDYDQDQSEKYYTKNHENINKPENNEQNIDNQNNQNENIEEEEDQKIKKIKSIYETFMDVSSIFSNPILQFKGQDQKKQKPRFFDDFDDESDEEQIQTINQQNNEQIVQNQISEHQSLFSNFGQNIWFNNKSSIIEQEDEDENQKQENQADTFIYNQNQEEDFQYLKNNAWATRQENQVGLSSSSLANLRKRALDPQREYQGSSQIKNDSKMNENGKKIVSLGALPVPKFIQEQQAKKQQYSSIFDDQEDQ